MGVGDFLRKGAQTPLTEHYLMAGAPGSISTNSEPILSAARECFCRLDNPSCEPRLYLRFWVDPKGATQPPWPKPFFRGLDHLIFAGFDNQSSILIDLRSRRAIGRFSPAMGADRAYWKACIFPVLISIMGATVGITELHCGCVVKNGSGLLLAGRSQSGKSTLAWALARAGWGYVSDDRTYCSEADGRLVAWGLPTLLKLRPGAVRWFPELKHAGPSTTPNGEQAFLIDPDHWPGMTCLRRSAPRWLVYLERQDGAAFDFAPMSPSEAATRLEGDLIAETREAAEAQRRTIQNLVRLPCWRLRHGEPPQMVAEKLARLSDEDRRGNIPRQSPGLYNAGPAKGPGQAETPHPHDVQNVGPPTSSLGHPLPSERAVVFRVRSPHPSIIALSLGERGDRKAEGAPRSARRGGEGSFPNAPHPPTNLRPELSTFYCLPGRAGGSPDGLACVHGDAPEQVGSEPATVKATRQDPLRRFTPTLFIANLPLLGRTVRFATDCPAIFKRTLRALERYGGTPASRPDFLWRIINEPRVKMKPPWPERSAFSDDGLRFINIGQRSFVAVDLDAREGVGFLAEGLASDEAGFATFFLDDVLYLTAGILGFVALSSACVAFGERGLLVFGPPNSGKTTSCYLAKKFGLEFLADQAVFLEIEADRLRAWGDLLPGVFRPETIQFLPELEALALPFCYRDLTFLRLPTDRFPVAARTRPVNPTGCVFLGRGESSAPNLVPLGGGEFRRRLAASLPFKDDPRFALRRAAVFKALEKVPAYHLAFGSDPAAAARFFPSLLNARSPLEATG